MSVTYTNRKGTTYYLCQTVTKRGKTRYYFAKEQKGDPPDEIPEGYSIRENVNGLVSLIKTRPIPFTPKEIAAVEKAIEEHPKARNYRIDVRHDWIEIHEMVGLALEEFAGLLGNIVPLFPHKFAQLREKEERRARFQPVLRFGLMDTKRRRFAVQRMCCMGITDRWIFAGSAKRIEELLDMWICQLGSEEFFGSL